MLTNAKAYLVVEVFLLGFLFLVGVFSWIAGEGVNLVFEFRDGVLDLGAVCGQIHYHGEIRSGCLSEYTYMSVQALVFLLLELSLSLEFLELGLFELLLVLATVNAVMNLRYPLNTNTLSSNEGSVTHLACPRTFCLDFSFSFFSLLLDPQTFLLFFSFLLSLTSVDGITELNATTSLRVSDQARNKIYTKNAYSHFIRPSVLLAVLFVFPRIALEGILEFVEFIKDSHGGLERVRRNGG